LAKKQGMKALEEEMERKDPAKKTQEEPEEE
jgi:hypothetical protein